MMQRGLHAVFERLIRPPSGPSLRLIPRWDLYGHAYLYDSISAHNHEDIGYALSVAREQGGRVLDVGGGTGRLAEVLAAAGCAVTMVDFSPAMLQVAARRHARLPLEAQSRWILRGADMCELALD